MSEKAMRLYINNTWVHQQGRYWIAKAIAFSENDNDLTITACHSSPQLAYERLIDGMKELGLLPADWEK
jgi:hypothetical protein